MNPSSKCQSLLVLGLLTHVLVTIDEPLGYLGKNQNSQAGTSKGCAQET